ncbi:cytochrome c oxidase assembly protein COX18, mitochondrial [Xylocopa sonorina]|uniref:cytochrome c oxidase assembly protein COX18, mitochondrial n=1 Tax=Xylocopa sonorina TaxID=1818115 RepID=UPI00403AF5A9
MTTRTFRKILLNFKYDSSSFINYSRSIHYASISCPNIHNNILHNNKVSAVCLSNERKFSSIQNTISHKNLLKRSLLSNNDTMLINRITSSHYPTIVNNVRQYSDSAPAIVKNTITYNGGIFQTISESLPVEWATEILRLMHYQTGLPWWASIILTTVITRTLIHLPFTILDHQTRAKRENLKGEIMEIAKKIKMEVEMEVATTQISPARAIVLYTRAMSKEQRELFERENCHPLKSLVITILQAPIWISFSVAMRNMCYMLPQVNDATLQDYNELSYGGFGWIQNLIDMDHYFILPIFFGISSLAIIEINQLLYNVPRSKFAKRYTTFCRVVIVALIPITVFVPSGLSLFWMTNNCCSLFQSLLLLSPKIRRLARIPKTDVEIQQPYTELRNRLLGKVYLKKSVARAQN